MQEGLVPLLRLVATAAWVGWARGGEAGVFVRDAAGVFHGARLVVTSHNNQTDPLFDLETGWCCG